MPVARLEHDAIETGANCVVATVAYGERFRISRPSDMCAAVEDLPFRPVQSGDHKDPFAITNERNLATLRRPRGPAFTLRRVGQTAQRFTVGLELVISRPSSRIAF